MEVDAPKPWFDALELIAKEKGRVLIIGATDTGKSTLTKFLITQLCRRGFPLGLIDTDVGQSFLGPPATIGFSLFKLHPDWGIVFSTPKIFFVGALSPEGHVPIFLKGVRRMLNRATSSEAEVILIDTTGFVSGEGGNELKRRKIDLLSPQFILALQRSDEIEPILEPYNKTPTIKIFRLPLSQQIKPRSMEERRLYRSNRFEDYFKHSLIHDLDLQDIVFEGEVLDPNGNPLPLEWALRISGLLIGLKDHQDDTLALGLTKKFFEEKNLLRILTPLSEIQNLKAIQLSSLKVIRLLPDEQRA